MRSYTARSIPLLLIVSTSRMTDLCAGKCCRSSETGSEMRVDPGFNRYVANASAPRLTTQLFDVTRRSPDVLISSINVAHPCLSWLIQRRTLLTGRHEERAVEIDRMPATYFAAVDADDRSLTSGNCCCCCCCSWC